MTKKTIVIIAVAVVILAVFLAWGAWQDNKRVVQLKAFAQCISKSEAKFYGAFWCPHCQDQKALFQTIFADASKDLPYIECSTPDSNGQLKVCQDANIKVYPTWKFANGTTHEGFLNIKELAEKTKCPLP